MVDGGGGGGGVGMLLSQHNTAGSRSLKPYNEVVSFHFPFDINCLCSWATFPSPCINQMAFKLWLSGTRPSLQYVCGEP